MNLKKRFVFFLLLQIADFTNALFEGCNNTYETTPIRKTILASPYYPDKYPAGSSCLYNFVAPLDYEIVADCSIDLAKGPNSCTTEYFFINRDGDGSLIGSNQFCGRGNLTRTSSFNRITFAYTSSTQGRGGRFLCTLTTRPQACDCGWSQSPRIVGGEAASKFEFPSTVGLHLKTNRNLFCGGSIINHRFVVTAAHCTQYVSGPEDVLIYAGFTYNVTAESGSYYAKIFEAEEFIQHEYYSYSGNVNDISLIKTTVDMEWSRGVGPICLPFGEQNNTFDFDTVDLVGWGSTQFSGVESAVLRKASVNVVPNSICQNYIGDVQHSQLCTYFPGRDSCQKDSGGPVVFKGSVREYLLGIISYGTFCTIGPGLNVRITSYLGWIYRNTNGSLCYKPTS